MDKINSLKSFRDHIVPRLVKDDLNIFWIVGIGRGPVV